MIADTILNWIPVKFNDDQFRWIYLGDKTFSEPFFEETISRCMHLPENSHPLKTVTDISIFPEWAKQVNTAKPAAIIFHVSRCGSTLLTQLLSLNPENIILSEVPLFDQLLRQGHKDTSVDSVSLLADTISFYTVKRTASAARYYIKTDSWHIHFYRQFRALFPKTPFIFLYRKPDEVLKSQQKRRGIQSVPGQLEPGIFNFSKDDITGVTLDEYMCMVLESYFSKFLEILSIDNNILLLNYSEGALSMMEKTAGITGEAISEEYTEKIKERSRFHGKYPDEVFAEEFAQTNFPLLLQKLNKLYYELEKRRDQTSAQILKRLA